MPTQTADQILQQLRAGQYAPVYVLQGEEPFEIDRISDFIEQHALAEHERGFNQVVLYGRDVDVATILGQARRYPLMAERSVVIVREAQNVADLEKETGVKLLLRYLEKPQPSTVPSIRRTKLCAAPPATATALVAATGTVVCP